MSDHTFQTTSRLPLQRFHSADLSVQLNLARSCSVGYRFLMEGVTFLCMLVDNVLNLIMTHVKSQ